MVFGKKLKVCIEFADNVFCVFYGAVAKWLRQRIKSPLQKLFDS